jgi:hypothetical protein
MPATFEAAFNTGDVEQVAARTPFARRCSVFQARSCPFHIEGKRVLVTGDVAQGAAKRLRLEQLPGYAPDLNPDEGIWARTSSTSNCATCAAPTCSTSSDTSVWQLLACVHFRPGV